MKNKGKLYLVATPIGNLSELSPRALEVLKSVDFIAAEDTRVTKKLCNHFGIDTPIFSNHEHNEKNKTDKIINLLLDEKNVAIVSDAGMPLISDPGYIIVQESTKYNIDVIVISGPTALINALVGSGLNTEHFLFYGFLSPSAIKEELFLLKDIEYTLVFYESKYRLKDTLKQLLLQLGNRQVVIARELTKIYEEYIRGNIEEVIEEISEDIKGEFVIVVSGAKKEESNENLLKSEMLIDELKNAGISRKKAIEIVQKIFDINKNILSNRYLNKNKNSL